MAIHNPGGTIVWRQLDAKDKPTLINALADALRDAGWTDSSVKAYVVLTFTGLPLNGQTTTLDGHVYTFVTVLSGAADEVLIGATAADCANNLADAINDNAVNEGVTYGVGTAANATLDAVVAGAAVTIEYQTAGTSGNGFTASEGLSNATLDSTVGRYGGRKLDSARTPDGLWYRVKLFDDSSYVNPRIQFSDVWETVLSPLFELGVTAGRFLNIRACRYEWEICLLGATFGGTAIQSAVPFLRDAHKPLLVSNAMDDGSGLVQITTSTPHGRATNDFVYLADGTIGGVYAPAINGSWQITVIDATNFTLQGSAWPGGVYDADSARAAGPKQIARLIWAQGDFDSTPYNNFRSQLQAVAAPFFQMFNEFSYSVSFPNNGGGRLMHRTPLGNGGNLIANFGDSYDVAEPVLCLRPQSNGAALKICAELWASFVADHAVPLDETKPVADGVHDVFQYSNDGTLSWWLWTS